MIIIKNTHLFRVQIIIREIDFKDTVKVRNGYIKINKVCLQILNLLKG
jgi:hypothetical protein